MDPPPLPDSRTGNAGSTGKTGGAWDTEVGELVRRGEALLDEAARRSAASARSRWARLRTAAPLIAQSALAAGTAWWLAQRVAGQGSAAEGHVPFFAPMAAIIVLGTAFGQRLRRAVELWLGVALGIAVADSLLRAIGHGPWQLVLVVALAMTAAVLVDGGQLIALQAATSSVLVATLVPSGDRLGGLDRFLDALLGGAVGLAVALLLLPLNPVVVARRHLEPVIEELAGSLDDVADALATHDVAAADAALERARAAEPMLAALASAVEASAEIARVAPARRGKRTSTGAYAEAAPQVDRAVRNARVLARRSTVVVRADAPVPPQLPPAIHRLAEAARLVGACIGSGEEPRGARALLVEAAALATSARVRELPLSTEVVVAQVRSVALDLLLATGVAREDGLELLAFAAE